jgi:hypothetical protein
MLSTSPGHFFNTNSATPTVHPPHAIEEENQKAPDGDELKSPLFEMIIAGAPLLATRAGWL